MNFGRARGGGRGGAWQAVGGKGGGSGLEGGGLGEILPKSLRHFLLNFGRARGGGRGAPGRRWEERGGGGGLEGGRPRGDPPKIAETATPAKF